MLRTKYYFCALCDTEIEGQPKHAIIRPGFPVFCNQWCIDEFVKKEKETKSN